MKTQPTAQAEYALLFLLTGKFLSELFPRKRGVKRTELVSVGANCQPAKPKKTRSHPVNPFMNTGREYADCKAHNFRTHSDNLSDHAFKFGVRMMSNVQKLPRAIRELPYHRPFAEGEQPNVGPQPMRN